jgi:hypothetical protein
MRMIEIKFGIGSFVVAIACLATLGESAGTALAQQGAAPTSAHSKRVRAKRSASKSTTRPKAETESKPVADRVVLRDGKQLLGQVDASSNDATLTIIARREMVRETLPKWAASWEAAETDVVTAALQQRHERLAVWRRERPAEPAQGGRITAWLDRELSPSAGPVAPSPLMAIRLDRDDVSGVERRSESAAQALRGAWVLGLANPETAGLPALKELIASRGMILANDVPIALDRLLPPFAEPEVRWLLRRAATEVLNDNGLQFIGFGNNILPEPMPGQPLNPAAGLALVEGALSDVLGTGRIASLPMGLGALAARGRSLLPAQLPGQSVDLAAGVRLADGAIRDALGAGRTDSLNLKLGAAAARGETGMILTRIGIAADLATAAAESTLLYYNGSNWDRAIWRSQSLEVGSVPPIVAKLVGGDPQVKAIMNLIDSVGAGFVPPEMNERGLAVATTVGGALIMARAALIRELTGLTFDVGGKTSRLTQQGASVKAH